jgi:beta-lactam-binding protein with PASTA domain
VGERQGAATATLRAAGFTVSIVAAPAPSAKLIRRVLAQRPGAGQLAGRGSTVTLVVGSRR